MKHGESTPLDAPLCRWWVCNVLRVIFHFVTEAHRSNTSNGRVHGDTQKAFKRHKKNVCLPAVRSPRRELVLLFEKWAVIKDDESWKAYVALRNYCSGQRQRIGSLFVLAALVHFWNCKCPAIKVIICFSLRRPLKAVVCWASELMRIIGQTPTEAKPKRINFYQDLEVE